MQLQVTWSNYDVCMFKKMQTCQCKGQIPGSIVCQLSAKHWCLGIWPQPTSEWGWFNHQCRSVIHLVGTGSSRYGGWPKQTKVSWFSGLQDIKLPLYGYALRDVINALINTVHDNTMAGIFTIGMLAVINFQFKRRCLLNCYCTYVVHTSGFSEIFTSFLGNLATYTTYFLRGLTQDYFGNDYQIPPKKSGSNHFQ